MDSHKLRNIDNRKSFSFLQQQQNDKKQKKNKNGQKKFLNETTLRKADFSA